MLSSKSSPKTVKRFVVRDAIMEEKRTLAEVYAEPLTSCFSERSFFSPIRGAALLGTSPSLKDLGLGANKSPWQGREAKEDSADAEAPEQEVQGVLSSSKSNYKLSIQLPPFQNAPNITRLLRSKSNYNSNSSSSNDNNSTGPSPLALPNGQQLEEKEEEEEEEEDKQQAPPRQLKAAWPSSRIQQSAEEFVAKQRAAWSEMTALGGGGGGKGCANEEGECGTCSITGSASSSNHGLAESFFEGVLGRLDLLITVSHCCKCDNHISLRHDEGQYYKSSIAMLGHLSRAALAFRPEVRLGLLRVPRREAECLSATLQPKFEVRNTAAHVKREESNVGKHEAAKRLIEEEKKKFDKPSSARHEARKEGGQQLRLQRRQGVVLGNVKDKSFVRSGRSRKQTPEEMEMERRLQLLRNEELEIVTTKNNKLLSNATRTSVSIGAFEVQVGFRSRHGLLVVETLFSKVASSKWPSKKEVAMKLIVFLEKHTMQIPATDGKEGEAALLEGDGEASREAPRCAYPLTCTRGCRPSEPATAQEDSVEGQPEECLKRLLQSLELKALHGNASLAPIRIDWWCDLTMLGSSSNMHEFKVGDIVDVLQIGEHILSPRKRHHVRRDTRGGSNSSIKSLRVGNAHQSRTTSDHSPSPPPPLHSRVGFPSPSKDKDKGSFKADHNKIWFFQGLLRGTVMSTHRDATYDVAYWPQNSNSTANEQAFTYIPITEDDHVDVGFAGSKLFVDVGFLDVGVSSEFIRRPGARSVLVAPSTSSTTIASSSSSSSSSSPPPSPSPSPSFYPTSPSSCSKRRFNFVFTDGRLAREKRPWRATTALSTSCSPLKAKHTPYLSIGDDAGNDETEQNVPLEHFAYSSFGSF